jgi:putative superfamily III holin-X
MSVPGVDQVGERPLEEMVQTASQQAVVLAREQVDLARRELAARARQAGPGAAMVSGGVLLGALASGTGTAALILLLARRPGASAAALGVTGAYVGAGALLAREGLVRLREAGPHLPDAPVEDDPVQDSVQAFGSAKRRTAAKSTRQTTAKSTRRTKHAAESARETTSAAGSARRTKSAKDPLLRSTNRPKPKSKTPSSRRRASSTD